MRRSFGGSRGMGGGGRMLRTVHRAVRTGVGGAPQEPFSHSSTTTTNNNSNGDTSATRPTYKRNASNVLSLSYSSTTSSPFPSFNLPISATSTAPTRPSPSSPTYSDEFEWEYVDASEDERVHGFYDDFVFGPVPSTDEVQHAVSALQQVLDTASLPKFIKDRIAYSSDTDATDQILSPTGFVQGGPSVESDLDWIEPSLKLCNSKTFHPPGPDRVYDVFHLLQTEPSVQRMVISLSSDKAVWDAILNNEVVQELRESLSEENIVPESSDEGSDGPNAVTDILSWIFVNSKAKVMQLIEKITKLVNKLFRPPASEKTTGATTYPFEEKLRSTFLLSVVVVLIVVVNRANRP